GRRPLAERAGVGEDPLLRVLQLGRAKAADFGEDPRALLARRRVLAAGDERFDDLVELAEALAHLFERVLRDLVLGVELDDRRVDLLGSFGSLERGVVDAGGAV